MHALKSEDHGPGNGSEVGRNYRGGVFGKGGEAETGADGDAALEPIIHFRVGRKGKIIGEQLKLHCSCIKECCKLFLPITKQKIDMQYGFEVFRQKKKKCKLVRKVF